eukprot:1206546-Prymnesium_polylepis.1
MHTNPFVSTDAPEQHCYWHSYTEMLTCLDDGRGNLLSGLMAAESQQAHADYALHAMDRQRQAIAGMRETSAASSGEAQGFREREQRSRAILQRGREVLWEVELDFSIRFRRGAWDTRTAASEAMWSIGIRSCSSRVCVLRVLSVRVVTCVRVCVGRVRVGPFG